MFETVLVANRGEIAVRVIRTLRAMGIRSVAVYSDADAGALHTRRPTSPSRSGRRRRPQSYLSIERVLEAAARTGAQADPPRLRLPVRERRVRPGLRRRPGIVFIGPPVAAIEAMGDKIRAKQTVMAAGVPVVPGRTEPGMTDDQVADAAVAVGFPVLLKPQRRRRRQGHAAWCASKAELPDAIAVGPPRGPRLLRRRHAAGRALRRQLPAHRDPGARRRPRQRHPPRRARVQPAAPAPEDRSRRRRRRCSTPASRAAMGRAAVEAAKAVGYTGAGTVEFIVDADRPRTSSSSWR